MINWLHAKTHRPEKGWDPVPAEWAAYYAEHEWQHLNTPFIQQLTELSDGFADKRVLDLGAGPGHHSITIAQLGAEVTWFDISQNYQQIARQKAQEHQVKLHWQLGYLDEVHQLPHAHFDIIFSSLCWYYAQNDKQLAQNVLKVLKPGGLLFILNNNINFLGNEVSTSTKVRAWLNHKTGLKIGHPPPYPGDTANLFNGLNIRKLIADYSDNKHDTVQIWKR